MKPENEEKIKKFWEEKHIYEKAKKSREIAKKFYFLDGPPYATGNIHIGTAWNKILKDCYIRFLRMRGFDVWDQPGYDTHGLPIENKVEKIIGIHSKMDIERFGIENFIKECRKFATQYIDAMNQQFADLGVWMDWNNPYLTLTNEYIESAWWTFKVAYEKGFLYRGLYPVHVCSHCETVVAYNEIEYTKLIDPSIYVKFPIKGKDNEYLLIWTTTPWTLPANAGVMANPRNDYVKVKSDDEILIMAKELAETVMEKLGKSFEIIELMKGEKLKGLEYIHPMKDIFDFQKKISHRIVMSEQFVSMEEGTGLVHCAPGHGQEDYKVGIENKLPVLSPVKPNGTFDESCGKFFGIYVKAADKDIIKELNSRNLLLHEEKVNHDYPQCWRCSTPLLFISVPQWFFKITDIRDKIIKENEKVNWFPSWAKQRFRNWLENLNDWPISRQRYWDIPLPIWICQECEKTKVIGSKDELPKKLLDFHRPYVDDITLNCECGGLMKRIPDVLDVWFDAGLASWASLGYPRNEKLFKHLWPSQLQIEGPDQIRGWWNSEIITSMITFEKAPFKNILFHGFFLDAHGVKMSKSKGNVVSCDNIIKKYGRDILRFYLLSSPAWNDFSFDWKKIEEMYKSFIIIENCFNFIKTYVPENGTKPEKPEDRWILSKLHSLVKQSTKNFEIYNVHKACIDIQEFIINDFSRWYIKIIRDRVWPKEDKSAFYTLIEATKIITKILAPITPFLAEKIHQEISKKHKEKEESIHLCMWPGFDENKIDKKLEKYMELVKEIVEASHALRHEKKIKSRWPLAEIIIESKEDLTDLNDIIKFMCNVKEVSFNKKSNFSSKEFSEGKIYLDMEMDEELKKEALFREVLRKIQNIRKKMKLVVKDRIEIKISNCDEMRFFENDLKKGTNAKTIKYTENKGEVLDFEGKSIKIEIKKI